MQTHNYFGQLSGEYQRLTEVAGFQDLPIADRTAAMMRQDVAGLTLYAETRQATGDSQHTSRRHFILAFESEEADFQPIEFVILRTNDPRCVWRAVKLINQHAYRIQSQISRAAQTHCSCHDHRCGTAAIGPVNVETIGGFRSADTREAIETSLAALTDGHEEHGYDGFVSAVCSTVDAWLASQSLWAPTELCSRVSRSVGPTDDG